MAFEASRVGKGSRVSPSEEMRVSHTCQIQTCGQRGAAPSTVVNLHLHRDALPFFLGPMSRAPWPPAPAHAHEMTDTAAQISLILGTTFGFTIFLVVIRICLQRRWKSRVIPIHQAQAAAATGS